MPIALMAKLKLSCMPAPSFMCDLLENRQTLRTVPQFLYFFSVFRYYFVRSEINLNIVARGHHNIDRDDIINHSLVHFSNEE